MIAHMCTRMIGVWLANGGSKVLRWAAILLVAWALLGSRQAIAQQAQADGPGQFAAEIAAFAAADEARASDCAIVFVGSSSIRMWRGLAADMAPYSVLNRGFGGATIADVNSYFDALIGHRASPAIFFYAGEKRRARSWPRSADFSS